MTLNALNLLYCKFHIAQIIVIEYIDNIIKGALGVFLSVLEHVYITIKNCFRVVFFDIQCKILT